MAESESNCVDEGDIQSYPIHNLFSRLLALRNMYNCRNWVRNALGMMDCPIHNAIVRLQNGTDIQPLFSISRAKECARWA